MSGQDKIYAMITDRFIKLMEQDVIPWKRTWKIRAPYSYSYNRPYAGINRMMLGMAPYSDPRFLTMKQVNDLGGKVNKGETSWPVILWKPFQKEVTDKAGIKSVKTLFFLTYFNVFNVEQTTGWTPKKLEGNQEHKPIEACENFVNNLPEKPEIVGSQQASYSPSSDKVSMPAIESFMTPEDYYAVLFHELVHWTGHESRLKREFAMFFTEKYGKEELVAELGSAFICNLTGIAPKVEENSASYLSNWMGKIKADPKLLMHAATKAQKAVDWMLNIKATEQTPESKVDLEAVEA